MDKNNSLTYLTPSFTGKPYDRMAVLGAISALWVASPLHAQWPVALLGINVLPALRCNQFLLACEGSQPVAFVSWAFFNDEAEARYIVNANSISEKDWNCGAHCWFIDWIAPFGQTAEIARVLERTFFPMEIARALRVRQDNNGRARVREFAGVGVSRKQLSENANAFEHRLEQHPSLRKIR